VKNILKALDQHHFDILVWQQRYGREWAVLLATTPWQLRWMQGTLDDSGLSGVDLRHYLERAGELFPFAEADTAEAALADLERRLSSLSDKQWERWEVKVREAYQALEDANPEAKELFVEEAYRKGQLVTVKV
jgi:hypothetical protein